ncbi:hypothetical protein ACIBCD_01015 [Nocardia brasiliensis]
MTRSRTRPHHAAGPLGTEPSEIDTPWISLASAVPRRSPVGMV